MLGWPNRRKLAHAFLWEYSYKRLQLARLPGQLGGFLTLMKSTRSPSTSLIVAMNLFLELNGSLSISGYFAFSRSMYGTASAGDT